MAAESAIAVQPPVDGWASGRYELLKTSTTGLTLVLTDAPEGATLGCTTAEGMTTYFADVTVAGEVEVVCEDETLLAAAKSQIRLAMDAAGVALTGIVKIKVVPGTGNKIVSELATGYVHVHYHPTAKIF